MELTILILACIILLMLAYSVYIQKGIIEYQEKLLEDHRKDQKHLFDDQIKALNEALSLSKQTSEVLKEKALLLRLLKMIWDARDTSAAEKCISNLLWGGLDGHQYTVQECYDQLQKDLGITDWGLISQDV